MLFLRSNCELMPKEELLKEISAEITACLKCKLSKTRKNAVPGDGDVNAKIIFIGEAPGRHEDLKGLPFVGTAGKLLDELLHKIALSRNTVYITNIVKCRPPDNRDPTLEEIAICTELYLARQIQAVQPKLLVMLGKHSAVHVLSRIGIRVAGITQIHGKVYEISPFGFPVVAIPTFHPAAALYNSRYKHLLEKDFKKLKSEFKKHCF